MRRRQRVGMLAVVAVALSGLASCTPAAQPHPGFKPTSSPFPKPGSSAWATKATIPVGGVLTMVGGPGAVYALPSDLAYDNVAALPVSVIRLGLGSATPTRSPGIIGASGLAISGSSLWVVAISHPGAAMLDQLDPTTLAIRRAIHLPDTSFGGLAEITSTAGGALWVGVGEQLYRVDTRSGGVTATLDMPGNITGLAVSPNFELLYVAVGERSGTFVAERDAKSGALVATKGPSGSGIGAQLSASGAGVWATYSSGLNGTVVELRASDLAQVAPLPPTSAGASVAPLAGFMSGPGGVLGTVSHGTLWLSSFGELGCANPETGVVLSSESFDTGVTSTVVATSNGIYVPTSAGIDIVEPPSVCGVGSGDTLRAHRRTAYSLRAALATSVAHKGTQVIRPLNR